MIAGSSSDGYFGTFECFKVRAPIMITQRGLQPIDGQTP